MHGHHCRYDTRYGRSLTITDAVQNATTRRLQHYHCCYYDYYNDDYDYVYDYDSYYY